MLQTGTNKNNLKESFMGEFSSAILKLIKISSLLNPVLHILLFADIITVQLIVEVSTLPT